MICVMIVMCLCILQNVFYECGEDSHVDGCLFGNDSTCNLAVSTTGVGEPG